MSSRGWWAIAAVCIVLIGLESNLIRALPGDSTLREAYPYYVGLSYRSLVEVVLVFAVTAGLLMRRRLSALGVLGLSAAPWTGLKAVGLMVLPLYLVFAVVFSFADMVPMEVLYLAVISPFAEELIYRGFAFGLLRKVAGWGFWPAALLPAAFFAWGHVDQANDVTSTIMTIALTGGGALVFSWLFEKWGGLWVPLGLHVAMNFAWNLFAVGEGAYAGVLPTVMQLVTIITAITLTRFRHRIKFLGSVTRAT